MLTNKEDVLQDAFVKSLGRLDEESKKIIWNTCISGSQIKRMFYNMKSFLMEKQTVGVEQVFSEKANEKMEMGKIMERVIRDTASKKWDLNIQYSPDTYALVENPFFTANIDGYIVRADNSIEIVEIKNTEETDIEKLYDYYKYQIQYYMWFFNAKSARLIGLSNGWHLQQLVVGRDEALIGEILNRANAIAKALKTGVLDENYFNNEVEEKDAKGIDIRYMEGEMEQKLDKLFELKNEVAEKEEIIKAWEQELKDLYANETDKVILSTTKCSYSLTTSERKGTINYKQYFADKEIDMAELEAYRGATTTTVRGVFTKI